MLLKLRNFWRYKGNCDIFHYAYIHNEYFVILRRIQFNLPTEHKHSSYNILNKLRTVSANLFFFT